MPNSVDPVYSGSTLFASKLDWSVLLGNYLQQTTSADDIFRCIFLGALRIKGQTQAPVGSLAAFLIHIYDVIGKPFQHHNLTALQSDTFISRSILYKACVCCV